MSKRSTVGLFCAGVALVGCQRGCAGLGREAPGAGGTAPPGSAAVGLDLSGTDCSDGLARCVEGRVEISRLAHLPHPCGSLKEGRNECVCPWDTVEDCALGCAVDGVVAIADADAGARQLCRSDVPVARPPIPGEPAAISTRICSGAEVACLDGTVRSCEGAGLPERVVAVCLHGCDPGIALDHGERMIGDGPATILCRRAHAERR